MQEYVLREVPLNLMFVGPLCRSLIPILMMLVLTKHSYTIFNQVFLQEQEAHSKHSYIIFNQVFCKNKKLTQASWPCKVTAT